MKLKNIQNKYLFILTLIFLCQGVIVFTNWLLYYPYGNEENIHWYQIIGYFILIILPAVALANIYLLSTFCKNKLGKIAINIITTIIAIIIYIFSEEEILCDKPEFDTNECFLHCHQGNILTN